MGCVALAFLVLTLVFTWPLGARLTTSLCGPPGDNYYFAWLVGWYEKALFGLHRLPLSVPQLNFPQGWSLAQNEATPAMVAIALPLSVLDGPVLGYNVALFVTFVLSGLGVYLWVLRLTRSRAAGLVAGVLFAFCAYRFRQPGHLNLMGTQWLALWFMSLHDVLRGPVRTKGIALAALFLGLIALTSLYYLYMTLLLSVVFVALYVWPDRHAWPNGLWRRLALVGLAALPLLALALAPSLMLVRQGGLQPRALDDASFWSASPTDFLFPPPSHLILGAWGALNYDRVLSWESTIYVGLVALLLAGVAIAPRGCLSRKRLVQCLALTALVAVVLALGTDLHWRHQPVTVPAPALLQRWFPSGRAPIPLPGYLLFRFLPLYAQMRVWMRYGILVNLFVSVLAGVGLAWLLQRVGRRWARIVAVVALALALVDLYPGLMQLSRISGRPVDDWLADQPGQGAVVQFPLDQCTLPTFTYYTLVHGKPFVGGFFAAGWPEQWRRIQPVLLGFPDQASLELLRGLHVQWICVDTRRFLAARRATMEALGLRLAYDSGGQSVWELRKEVGPK